MNRFLFLSLVFLAWTPILTAQRNTLVPIVDKAVYFDVSPPLRDMVKMPLKAYDGTWKDGVVMNYFPSQYGNPENRYYPSDAGRQEFFGKTLTDSTIQNFDGQNGGSYVPPDTHGDIGRNYYFQVVNCAYSIYNKSGHRVFGPMGNSTVWSGMPNNSNDGDAIVHYDEQADRWLFSQFSLPHGSSTPPFFMMVAVSQTSDPTGSWYRWQYEFSAMPDYPKFGIWSDGYYLSTNNFVSGMGWVGNGACSFDRAAMLAGDPEARMISFTLPAGSEGFITLLPADCDGVFPPAGTPGYFTYIKTQDQQHLGIIEFHSDWDNPANSTFGNIQWLDVIPFNTMGWDTGIPQKDSPQLLETLGDRLMCRLQFRQFNGFGSMVLNHTVDAGSGVAGVRWYELRNTGSGWSIYQQSTYAPADGNCRWMASIAQDTAGSIALGYSVSGYEMFPAIRYTGRLAGDPLNQMTIAEKTIINGGGSQTGNWNGRSRWGDYSSMTVDPSCPTTFWYTTEYYVITSSGSWATRVGSFSFSNVFSSAASATPAQMCSHLPDSSQLVSYAYGGSSNYTWSWTSIPPGFTSDISNPKVKPAVTTKYIAEVSDGTQVRRDTVEVRIVPGPSGFAGNDTTVCWYVTEVPVVGYAENYNRIAWGTTGDGSFSDSFSLNTIYYPGNGDRSNGSAMLVLYIQPRYPCTGNIFLHKTLYLDQCTGIGTPAGDQPAMEINPNPAHDRVTVTLTGMKNPSAILTLFSLTGQSLLTTEITAAEKRTTKELDLRNFRKGTYLLQLKSGSGVITEKLVIQ